MDSLDKISSNVDDLLDMVAIVTDQFPDLFSKHLNCPIALRIVRKRCQLAKSNKLLTSSLKHRMILKEERDLDICQFTPDHLSEAKL